MSDQALEQSQELSVEDRMAALLTPEEEKQEKQEAAPQDNEPEATEAVEEETPEGEEQVEATEEEAEPDLVEIDVEGEKYDVPTKVRDAILASSEGAMLQADYTRKTQEVAEQRKQVEVAQAQLQQAAQLQQQSLVEYAELMALDKQLQAYNQVDWNALYDSDPAEFVRLKEGRRDLIDQRGHMANQITAKQQEQYAQQQQTMIQVVEEGKKVLAREIPNWNTELATTLNQFAVDKFGFTAQEVGAVTDPRVVKLLHKAYLYDKQVSGKAITDKRVANLPKVSKPGSVQKQSVQGSRETDARKILKKTGSTDAAQAVFLARYSK